MTPRELERRIALVRSIKSTIEGRKVPNEVLRDLLPDGEPNPTTRQMTTVKWAKAKRRGVVGVTTFRRGERVLFRAHIRTPDGIDLKSSPVAEWWRAVRQRNRWAEKYYSGQPEFQCDYEAAMDLWGGET